MKCLDEIITLNKKKGKKLLIVCGVHGNETSAVASVVELKKDIKLLKLKNISSIRFMIGVNETGILYNTREYVNVSDNGGNDLNRLFQKDDGLSRKNEIILSIKNAVSNSDYVIDVHASPFIKNCVTIDYDESVGYLDNFFRLNNIFHVIRNTASNNTLKKYACSKGKIGITAEINGMGFSSNLILNVNFIKSIIDSLDGIGKKDITTYSTAFQKEIGLNSISFDIFSKKEGIIKYVSHLKDDILGRYPAKAVIAYIYDYHDNLIDTVEAPCLGTLYAVSENLIGTTIGMFQPD